MPEYEPVIGMECHAELLTESKMFCRCPNQFGGEPNTRCCPVCMGLPGSLPVPNRRAVEYVIRTALALNCEVNRQTRFDRKNYFYPDLPKGYQISQYDLPIGVRGWLDIEVDGRTTRVQIRRVHLEEDTGKLLHTVGDESEVDFNRSGVPLMEIVTEFPPDIHSAEEARAYLVKLRSILTFLGVCDGKMEQGSLRCEPNVSVRLMGSGEFGVKTEIKNLNSFRAVYRGVEHEVERQIGLLKRGEKIIQETRGWNEAQGATYSMRSKELEQEYRYFPEPDIPPMLITGDWLEEIRRTMPELPDAKRNRFLNQYGLSEYDADLLTETRAIASYFEAVPGVADDPKSVANWITGDLARLLNAHNEEIDQCRIIPQRLGDMIDMIKSGVISGKIAKTIFDEMYESGRSAGELVAQHGLTQISDEAALAAMVDRVVEAEAEVVAAIQNGKVNKFGYLVGQVMKESQGRANPQEVNRLLKKRLSL